eukprot:Opistho-1_new@92969
MIFALGRILRQNNRRNLAHENRVPYSTAEHEERVRPRLLHAHRRQHSIPRARHEAEDLQQRPRILLKAALRVQTLADNPRVRRLPRHVRDENHDARLPVEEEKYEKDKLEDLRRVRADRDETLPPVHIAHQSEHAQKLEDAHEVEHADESGRTEGRRAADPLELNDEVNRNNRNEIGEEPRLEVLESGALWVEIDLAREGVLDARAKVDADVHDHDDVQHGRAEEHVVRKRVEKEGEHDWERDHRVDDLEENENVPQQPHVRARVQHALLPVVRLHLPHHLRLEKKTPRAAPHRRQRRSRLLPQLFRRELPLGLHALRGKRQPRRLPPKRRKRAHFISALRRFPHVLLAPMYSALI